MSDLRREVTSWNTVVRMVRYREIFSHTSDAIGLKVIRVQHGRYKYTDSKCFALYYYIDTHTFRYVVGRCYDDQFHPYRVDRGDPFMDTMPYWLTPYHRARARALLTRFRDIMRSDPAALRMMGMAAFLKLEKLLVPAQKQARR